MNESYDPNLLLEYVEGELPDDARQPVEAMLAEDPKLAALVEGMQRDRAALREAHPGELPRDLVSGALTQVEREMLLDEDVAVPSPTVASPVSRFRLAPLLTYGGIAAVLALTGAVVFQSLLSDTPDPADSAYAMNEQAPGVGLAEAPLEAQRLAAAKDTGTSESDALAFAESKAEPSALGDALAAVERAADPAADSSREYFEGFAETAALPEPTAPAAPSAVASVGFDAEAPRDFLGLDANETARFASAAPRYRVNVYTRSADQTRHQLENWAYSNRVALVEEEATSGSFGFDDRPAAELIDAQPGRSPAAASPAAASDDANQEKSRELAVASANSAGGPKKHVGRANQQLVLTLDPQQVGELLTELNRDNLRQNAFVLDNHAPALLAYTAVAATPSRGAANTTDDRAIFGDEPRTLRREQAAFKRSAEAIAETDVNDEVAPTFNLADSLRGVSANEPADVSESAVARDMAKAVVGARSDAAVEDRHDPKLDADAFFYLAPAVQAMPWRNWHGRPETVLVEVVIEEAPATLRQAPPTTAE